MSAGSPLATPLIQVVSNVKGDVSGLCWESPRPPLSLMIFKKYSQNANAFMLMLMAHYSERIKININKGKKGYRVEARRKQVQASSCPLSLVSYRQCVILPATTYDMLPTNKAYLNLDV